MPPSGGLLRLPPLPPPSARGNHFLCSHKTVFAPRLHTTHSALSEDVLRESVASPSVHHLPLGSSSGVRGLLSELPWSFPPPLIPTQNLTPEHTQWESNIRSWTRFITRADTKNICQPSECGRRPIRKLRTNRASSLSIVSKELQAFTQPLLA